MSPAPGTGQEEAGKRGGARRTRVVCGLDEAGLGPLLGPLTIGFSAFEVPGDEPDLWKLLRKVCARKKGKRVRIVVADSKQVFTRNPEGWKRLERTALSFASLMDAEGRPPRDPRTLLFGELAPIAPASEELERHPWYAELPSLPVVHEAGTIELAAAGLRRELETKGARLLGCGVRIVPSGELNDSFEDTRNKADTVWKHVGSVLAHFWELHGARDPEVTVDVLGGRMRYGSLLQRLFPGTRLEVVQEEPEHSEYLLCEHDDAEGTRWLPRRMRVAFRVRGEERSFATALASCMAKYARELSMEAFNAYFGRFGKDLRPTAGYRGDARRWLEDARTALGVSGIDREVLIRTR